MRFRIGSELATEMNELSDMYVLTKDGPYELKDIERMTFTSTAPDTARLEYLSEKGIAIYVKTKRYKSLHERREKAKLDSIRGLIMPKAPVTKQPYRDDYHALTSAGVGFGLDYGGLGARFTLYPTSIVSGFAGAGYNFQGFAYNMGLEINFTPTLYSTGFFSALYGYNAVML